MDATARLYPAAIAAASGLYSLWSATGGTRMTTAGWLMALLGLVVIVHGVVLLTDAADLLGGASGPLMIVYAAAMLLLQGLLGTGMLADGRGMDGGMGGSPMTAGMGWDAGMVALAALMLASGLIMTRAGPMAGSQKKM